MDEHVGQDRTVPPGLDEEQALAVAHGALLDAREELVGDREQRADARDAASDERDRAADGRDGAVAADAELNQRLRTELESRAERLNELIAGADARDRAAELRDRAADAREAAAALRAERRRADQCLDRRDQGESEIDRLWAGSDRDASAIDRAALRDMVRKGPQSLRPVPD